jgi:hypothetical protein
VKVGEVNIGEVATAATRPALTGTVKASLALTF